jgi:hypothetical protein
MNDDLEITSKARVSIRQEAPAPNRVRSSRLSIARTSASSRTVSACAFSSDSLWRSARAASFPEEGEGDPGIPGDPEAARAGDRLADKVADGGDRADDGERANHSGEPESLYESSCAFASGDALLFLDASASDASLASLALQVVG